MRTSGAIRWSGRRQPSTSLSASARNIAGRSAASAILACRGPKGSRGRSTASAARSTTPRRQRRRALHGEPLQGRHLALSGVRAARRHLPGDPRTHRVRHTSGCSTTRRMRWSAATIRCASCEKVKHRVVSMHASDRYLAPGTTLDDLATGDGALGYAAALTHGETGQGSNDYDTIFRILREVELRRVDLHRGRHERSRRDRPLGGVPEGEAAPSTTRRRDARKPGLGTRDSGLGVQARASRRSNPVPDPASLIPSPQSSPLFETRPNPRYRGQRRSMTPRCGPRVRGQRARRPRRSRSMCERSPIQCIIPPYINEHLAKSAESGCCGRGPSPTSKPARRCAPSASWRRRCRR